MEPTDVTQNPLPSPGIEIQQPPAPVPEQTPSSGKKKMIVLFGVLGIFLIGGVAVYTYMTRQIFTKAVGTQKQIEQKLLQVTSNKKITPVPLNPTVPSKSAHKPYIVVFAPGSTKIELTDFQGTALQEGNGTDSGKTGKDLYYFKPETGVYYLTALSVSGDGLSIMLYDTQGAETDSNFFSESGTASAKFRITFNKSSTSSSKIELIQ